jgi:hypothetical protein
MRFFIDYTSPHLARDLRGIVVHLLIAEERVLPPLLTGGARAHARVEQGLALLRCVAHEVLVHGVLDGDGGLKHLHHYLPHLLSGVGLRAVKDHVSLEVRELFRLAKLVPIACHLPSPFLSFRVFTRRV